MRLAVRRLHTGMQSDAMCCAHAAISDWTAGQGRQKQVNTSLQPSMTPNTLVSTMLISSVSEYSPRGPYLYAFEPALLILHVHTVCVHHGGIIVS